MVSGQRRPGAPVLRMFAALCLAWQGAVLASAPPAAPVFRTFGTAEGLPSRQVHALAQDDDGRLWIGTAFGLARYDGHRMQRFLPHPEWPGALPSGSVDALHVDAQGRLWVASQGARLSRLERGSEYFAPVELPGLAAEAAIELWSITSTPDRLWVAGYGTGLIELDGGGRWLARHGVETGLPGMHLIDVVAGAEGLLWVLDFERRLGAFDPATSRYRALPGEHAVIGLGIVDGALAYTTRVGELCRVDQAMVPRCSAVAGAAEAGALRVVLGGRRGLWLGGHGELLIEADGRSLRVGHVPGAVGGLPAEHFSMGLEDREGGRWLGSFGGGLLHLPLSAERFRSWQPGQGLTDARVRGLARDRGRRIWIGTMNGGVHRLDPAHGRIAPVAWPGEGPAVRRVFALAFDSADQLWLGTREGLYRWMLDSAGEPLAVQAVPALDGESVDLLWLAADGALWAAAMGSGLYRIDTVGLAVQAFPFSAEGFAGTEVQMLGAGADGSPWVATDRGLYRYAQDCVCLRALLLGSMVEAFAVESGDVVHAFVDGQLVRYRWRGALFRDESHAPLRLPALQSTGGMALVDGSLWLAGIQGLLRHRLADGKNTHWDERDGLVATEFSDRPFLIDDGVLWLGSERGLIRVDTRLPDPWPAPPRLRFDRVSVEGVTGERMLPTAGLARVGAAETGLTLAVRLDRLERPHAQRFAFRLDREGEDWPAPVASPERVFGSLPPGRHRIEVRAWDGHGLAAANTLALDVHVAAPWWRSEQGYLAYASLALIVLALIEAARRRRRRNDEALAEARRQAEWNGRLAGAARALIAEVGHEVRNPLNGMLGMARLIADGPLPPEARRQVDLLQDAGRQLARLMDDLTDWSRLEAGRGELSLQPVRLVELLEACLARHAAAAQAKGLDFDSRIPNELVVFADPARLLQIADNLVGNAVKYTQGGRVDVRAELLASHPDRVALRVSDTGPGLTDADLERLFQPYERLSNARHAPGVGLGLAISRGLAERMQGELRAAPAPGGGAEFTLVLAAASRPPEAARPAREEEGVPRLDGLRLLLVEDDATGAEALVGALRALGADVTHAGDALSALPVLARQSADAVLLDIDLPGMSGLELARVIGAGPAPPPLIAMSGRTTPEDRAAAAAAGIAVYLAKPVEVETVAREVRSRVARP